MLLENKLFRQSLLKWVNVSRKLLKSDISELKSLSFIGLRQIAILYCTVAESEKELKESLHYKVLFRGKVISKLHSKTKIMASHPITLCKQVGNKGTV